MRIAWFLPTFLPEASRCLDLDRLLVYDGRGSCFIWNNNERIFNSCFRSSAQARMRMNPHNGLRRLQVSPQSSFNIQVPRYRLRVTSSDVTLLATFIFVSPAAWLWRRGRLSSSSQYSLYYIARVPYYYDTVLLYNY